jgi:hypothetical protein
MDGERSVLSTARLLGARHTLRKPFGMEEMLSMIRYGFDPGVAIPIWSTFPEGGRVRRFGWVAGEGMSSTVGCNLWPPVATV